MLPWIVSFVGLLGILCVAVRARDTDAAAPADGGPAPTPAHNRALGLTGAPNFRDIGGYATQNSKHVRWGTVYRSSGLGNLTPADATRVAQLKLAAVVDLRTQDERTHSPDVWILHPRDVYESPKPTLAPVMRSVLTGAQTAQGARAAMRSFYAEMPDIYGEEYSAFFHRIAAGELPILVHCTAGKDRTGVAIAVLLRSLGVPLQNIVADYELTGSFTPAVAMARNAATPTGATAAAHPRLAELPEESRVALWQSNADYIQAALDSIDREYGSIDVYLTRGLGLSNREVTSIRRALTE